MAFELLVRGKPLPVSDSSQRYHPVGLHLPLVLLVFVVGCGPDNGSLPTYPVTGEVVFADGSPLRGGRVEFRSMDNSPAVVASGHFGDDGKFQLRTYRPGDGAVEGEHQVVVSPDPPNDDDTDKMTPAQRMRAMRPIDTRFLDYRSSKLQFKVTDDAAQNHFRIEVWHPGEGPRR